MPFPRTAPRPGSHDLAVSLALATLPRPLVARLLRRIGGAVPRRHPKLAARLAELAGKRLLIAPDELPYALLVEFPGGKLAITPVDGPAAPASDAALRGPLRLFFALVRGGSDGDALFFTRALAVTGDMAVAVALRNAMDGAGVDLFADVLALPPPLGSLLRGGGGVLDRCAGVLLAELAARTTRLEADLAGLRAELRRLKDAAPKPRPKAGPALAALGPRA